MRREALLYEGKAKRIYATDDTSLVWIEYKDDATAFNGEKKANIAGKGRLNNEISALLFEKLASEGIENHFVEKLSETEQLVKKTKIIPLEVVVRNIAAGSLSKRLGLEEGKALKRTIVEFYYKNDELGDPLLNGDHIEIMNLADDEQLKKMRKIALHVNDSLISHFDSCGLRLVDFKLEFGIDTSGTLILSDEVSPDTCRLWDKETNEKFDKDVFRRNLGSLTDAYEEILKRLGGTKTCTK